MSNYRVGETADLYDPVTGAWIGVLDRNGKEQEVATPAAVAAALGGTTDPNTGDIRLNIIPRTGTLPALLSISGNEGEIASVTGAGQPPALVSLDGSPGGAAQITACDNVLTVTTASPTATVTTKPDGQKLFFTNSVGGTVYALTLGAGYFVGQRVVVEADFDTSTEVDLTILDGALALNNASSTYGNAVEVAWTGVGWKYQRGFATRAGNFSESLAGATAPFSNGAVAIGRGVVTVSKDGGFVVCTNPANTNVDANNKYEVKLGVGSRSAEGFAELFAAGVAGTFELTTDGAAGSSANRIAFQAGMIYRCRLVVNARVASLATTNTYWSGIRDFAVCVKNDGTAITVSSVNTLGTDLSTVTGTAPSLAIAGSSGKLTVNFTHGHSASLNVRAVLEVLGSYGA